MTERESQLLEQIKRIGLDAPAFAVVTVDADTRDVLHAVGPFDEPEGALVQAGLDDNRWKRATTPAEDARLEYLVVPLWEPDL